MMGNILIHIPVGVVNVLIAIFNGWLGLIFGIGFIVYELSQERLIKDEAYPAIQGYLIGLGVAVIPLLIWSWIYGC
jgi:hypothetical protein